MRRRHLSNIVASVAAGRWCCPYRRSVRSCPRCTMRLPTYVSAHGRAARRASALLRDLWRPATGKCTYSRRISSPCERRMHVPSTETCVKLIFAIFRTFYRVNRHPRLHHGALHRRGVGAAMRTCRLFLHDVFTSFSRLITHFLRDLSQENSSKARGLMVSRCSGTL